MSSKIIFAAVVLACAFVRADEATPLHPAFVKIEGYSITDGSYCSASGTIREGGAREYFNTQFGNGQIYAKPSFADEIVFSFLGSSSTYNNFSIAGKTSPYYLGDRAWGLPMTNLYVHWSMDKGVFCRVVNSSRFPIEISDSGREGTLRTLQSGVGATLPIKGFLTINASADKETFTAEATWSGESRTFNGSTSIYAADALGRVVVTSKPDERKGLHYIPMHNDRAKASTLYGKKNDVVTSVSFDTDVHILFYSLYSTNDWGIATMWAKSGSWEAHNFGMHLSVDDDLTGWWWGGIAPFEDTSFQLKGIDVETGKITYTVRCWQTPAEGFGGGSATIYAVAEGAFYPDTPADHRAAVSCGTGVATFVVEFDAIGDTWKITGY